MARKKKLILPTPGRTGPVVIKVRLDDRTIITLSNLMSFEFWKHRYPQAKVIQ